MLFKEGTACHCNLTNVRGRWENFCNSATWRLNTWLSCSKFSKERILGFLSSKSVLPQFNSTCKAKKGSTDTEMVFFFLETRGGTMVTTYIKHFLPAFARTGNGTSKSISAAIHVLGCVAVTRRSSLALAYNWTQTFLVHFCNWQLFSGFCVTKRITENPSCQVPDS